LKLFTAKPDFVISKTGISSVEKVRLGEIDQYILIQAEDTTKPVLLFLHGGPSMPVPGVSNRGKDYTLATNTKELIKNFVLVFWDQRGTGKSYNSRIDQETMTLSQFISDGNELIDFLRERFSREKIFLVGHSWGSLLGLSLVQRFPEKIYSYVGISQIVNWAKNDELVLEWAKNEAVKRKNNKGLAKLNAIGQPPFIESMDQWGEIRKWTMKRMVYSDDEIKHPGLFKSTIVLWRSKDYSLMDVYNSFIRGFKLVFHLGFIKEIAQVDFNQQLPYVSIPVTFIHGRKDTHLYGQLAEEYYNLLKAEKGKRFIWMDKSSHVFHPDDTKLIEQHIIEELKHYTI
jgi:pimeloyl-ACP methyl ester carboxylesterase